MKPGNIVCLLLLFFLSIGFFLFHNRRSVYDEHPTLAIGSPAPDFKLPGTDGKIIRWPILKPPNYWVVVYLQPLPHCPGV